MTNMEYFAAKELPPQKSLADRINEKVFSAKSVEKLLAKRLFYKFKNSVHDFLVGPVGGYKMETSHKSPQGLAVDIYSSITMMLNSGERADVYVPMPNPGTGKIEPRFGVSTNDAARLGKSTCLMVVWPDDPANGVVTFRLGVPGIVQSTPTTDGFVDSDFYMGVLILDEFSIEVAPNLRGEVSLVLANKLGQLLNSL